MGAETPEMRQELTLVAYAMVGGIYLVMLLIGLYYYYRPPKEINGFYGYRTSRSMKNQANWDFANHLGARYMLYSFQVFLIGSLLFIWLIGPYVSVHLSMLFPMGLLMVSLIAVIPLVESRLKRFEQKNNPMPEGNTISGTVDKSNNSTQTEEERKATSKMLLVAICAGVVLLYVLIGAINLGLYLNPPKKINPRVGYRTEFSMKNQANWDYANKLGAEVSLYAIHVFLLTSLLLIIMANKRVKPATLAGLISLNLILCISAPIPIVEHKLRQFEEQQK